MTNRLQLQRLVLDVERALAARANFRLLLAASDATVVQRRQELRALKARLKRGSPSPSTSRRSPGPGRPR